MASRTLPALIAEANDLTDALIESGGETTPELDALLEMSGREIKSKVDAYGAVIDALKDRQRYALDRMKQWEEMASSYDRALDNIKLRVKSALNALDLTELHGYEYSFRVMANPPAVIVDDQEKIPIEFITAEVKTTTKVDKKNILDAIKDGRTVPGVHIERGSRLISKVSGRKELGPKNESEKS